MGQLLNNNPVHKLTKEDRIKGARTKSPKRKWAARLRELKKKGLTDANSKLLTDMLTEKDSFAMDTLMWLQSMKKECNNVGEKTNIARVLNDVCKLVHGEKIKTENVHHIIDWGKILDNCVVDDEET